MGKQVGKCGVSGAHFEGRFANLIAKPDAFEVRVMPIFWMILSLWVFAILFFYIGTFTGSVTVALLLTLLGAAFGSFLVLGLYSGRLLGRYEYGEIVSFVLDKPELAVNLKSGAMLSVRLSDKRQQRLLLCLVDMLELGGEYHFERSGQYFRIKPNAAPEVQPPPPAGTPPKKKKAVEAQRRREEEARVTPEAEAGE